MDGEPVEGPAAGEEQQTKAKGGKHPKMQKEPHGHGPHGAHEGHGPHKGH